MPSESKTFNGTPRTAAMLNPHVGAAHPGTDTGIPWGVNMQTHQWLCPDLPELQELRVINGKTMEVDGERDTGKSAFVKYLIKLGGGTQADINEETGRPNPFRILGLDGKPDGGEPELLDVCNDSHGSVVDPLANGRRINAFDWLLNDEVSMVDKGLSIAELVLRRPLRDNEPLAIMVAVAIMCDEIKEGSRTEVLADILRGLTKADADAYSQGKSDELLKQAEEKYTEKEEGKTKPLPGKEKLLESLRGVNARKSTLPANDFERDAASMAAALLRFTGPEFGNAFGGTDTMAHYFSERFVLFNRSSMSPRVRVAFDSLMHDFMAHNMVHNKVDLIPHLRVTEEIQEDYQNPMLLKSLDFESRKARAFHTWSVGITQYGRQLRTVGEPDSELRNLAKSINLGVAIKVMFRQPYDPDVLDYLVNSTRLSDEDAYHTTGLPLGCAAVKFGDWPVIWMQNIIPPSILKLIETNTANKRLRNRINIHTMQEVRELAKKFEEEYKKGISDDTPAA